MGHERRWVWVWVVGWTGCVASGPAAVSDSEGIGTIASRGSDTGVSSGPSETGSSSTASDGGDASSGGGVKYDVAMPSYCADQAAGIHCEGSLAHTCDGDGKLVDTIDCAPDLCVTGTGCVVCVDGEYHCQGAKVMACDAAAVPARWVPIDTCDPAANEGCDRATGTCEVLEPVGSDVPTGVYYQFADFHTADGVFAGGADVAGRGDKLYIVRTAHDIDVYQVGLVDGDGDGELEPNQHPDNPDATGPIEPRTLTFVETIATPESYLISPNANELVVLEDRIIIGGKHLTEQVFGGAPVRLSTASGWIARYSMLGFDEINGVLYGGNEQRRRVIQYDASDHTWGLAFAYPPLAGAHMDGMDVVTHPVTGVPYVYVSDMTSDFLAQYRLDRQLGWVQENLFAYAGTVGAPVEGMGFGPLFHFWTTSNTGLYEIGGGDLIEYTQPPG